MKKNFTLFVLLFLSVFLLSFVSRFVPHYSLPGGRVAYGPTRYLNSITQDTTTYKVKIIPADSSTFGYEIYSNKKLLIRQINIPGFSGMKGFKRKADAESVANLVVTKLQKGIMPPTVERAEMEKLNVLF